MIWKKNPESNNFCSLTDYYRRNENIWTSSEPGLNKKFYFQWSDLGNLNQ